MRLEDKIRIKEAMEISARFGETIWPGFNEVPFTLLLITDSVEFLIHHPDPPEEFRSLGSDTLLNTEIFHRPRMFPSHLLATFPAVTGQNTIVVGTPENTGKSSADWILTLLHEHFHQYQSAAPDHYQLVDSLDLSGGDLTGMWMLNYPFPYQDEKTGAAYSEFLDALVAALIDHDGSSLSNYRSTRDRFKAALDPKDYAYFSFQLWQEGIARYTEYKFAEFLKDRPLPQGISLNERTYADVLGTLSSSATSIQQCDPGEQQRICFYEVGLAEGLLLDRVAPQWRERYLQQKFFLENFMPAEDR